MIAYPVATDAHEALSLLRQGKVNRAAREKAAETVAGQRVAFVTQSVGPVFETLDDALAAYAGLVEDTRVGHVFVPAAEDRFCRLAPRIKTPAPARRKPMKPVFKDGERWPKGAQPTPSAWQLSISYWKIVPASRAASTATNLQDQARKLRKSSKGGELTADEILGLAQSPLVAMRPQKALDFGLFDFQLPENPSITIADE